MTPLSLRKQLLGLAGWRAGGLAGWLAASFLAGAAGGLASANAGAFYAQLVRPA